MCKIYTLIISQNKVSNPSIHTRIGNLVIFLPCSLQFSYHVDLVASTKKHWFIYASWVYVLVCWGQVVWFSLIKILPLIIPKPPCIHPEPEIGQLCECEISLSSDLGCSWSNDFPVSADWKSETGELKYWRLNEFPGFPGGFLVHLYFKLLNIN